MRQQESSWASLLAATTAGAAAGVALGLALANNGLIPVPAPAAQQKRAAADATPEFGRAPPNAVDAGRFKPDADGRMAANRQRVQRVPLEDMPPLQNDLLLRAARGEETERVPVWMMRQAGRYLPEFRKLRESADFFTMCQTPELATEVTLQPLERFPTLDAVIVFSDILVVPQAMGMEVRMQPGKGPVFPHPLQTPADLDALNMTPDLEQTLGYVFDVVNLTRQRVQGRVPVIGFAGAPFTLMGYMIEGGGSKTMSKAKQWLYNHPDASKRLLGALADLIVEYAVGKVRAGAQLIQVFESNGGDLGPDLFEEFSMPYLERIATRLRARLAEERLPNVPLTCFARNVHHEGALEALAALDYNVLGIDWAIRPAVARRRVDPKLAAVQGNLDPCALFAAPEQIRARVEDMLQGFGTRGYIANLGHGMLPEHDPEHARAFIEAVQDVSLRMNGMVNSEQSFADAAKMPADPDAAAVPGPGADVVAESETESSDPGGLVHDGVSFADALLQPKPK